MPAVSMACRKGRHYDCKGLADTVSPYAIPCACPCHRREDIVMEKTRCPLHRAEEVANEMVKLLESACARITIAGSIRRQKPEVSDIELLVIPKYAGLADMLDREIQTLLFGGILDFRRNKRGSRVYGPKNKLMVHVPSGIAVDLFSSTEENWGMALFVRTGPREWNIKAMSRFRELGMQGHAYGGVTDAEGNELGCPDEETIFGYLGWAYVPPERRT